MKLTKEDIDKARESLESLIDSAGASGYATEACVIEAQAYINRLCEAAVEPDSLRGQKSCFGVLRRQNKVRRAMTMELTSKDFELGKLAYDAYAKQAGGVSLISGEKLPEFGALKSDIQFSWAAAAIAVANHVHNTKPIV